MPRRPLTACVLLLSLLAASTAGSAFEVPADGLIDWAGAVFSVPGAGWTANAGDEAVVLYHGVRAAADFVVVSLESPTPDAGLGELIPGADGVLLREELTRYLADWCARHYGELRRLRRYDAAGSAPAVLLEFLTTDELNHHRVYLFLPPTGRLYLLTIRCRAAAPEHLHLDLERLAETIVFQ